MEGYARVRIAGQTDWKRVWLVVQEGSEGVDHAATSVAVSAAQATVKKKRMSNLFSREQNVPNFAVPTRATVSLYSGPKPKDRKKPLLTVHSVTQAFGVYPERPELIDRSTLIKIEGTLGDDDIAGTLRGREAWVLIMPELENSVGQAAEMLKWVIGKLVYFNSICRIVVTIFKRFMMPLNFTGGRMLGHGILVILFL